MIARRPPPTAAEVARLRALDDAPLPLDEYRRLASMPINPEERAATLELIRWFRRRYPTPAARLAAARRLVLQQQPRR